MIRRVTAVPVDGATEPIDVSDMEEWSRGTLGSQASLVTNLITAVRDLFERITGRVLISKTITIYIDTIPGGTLPWWQGVREGARTAEMGRSIDLINPPTVDITSISTFDIDNTEITWDPANYYLDNTDPEQIARVCLNIGAFWPTNLRPRDALKIVVTAGYGDDFPIPESIKLAMKMMVMYLFNNRGDCSEAGACSCGAMSMLQPYVLVDIFPRVEDGRPQGLHTSFDGEFSDG